MKEYRSNRDCVTQAVPQNPAPAAATATVTASRTVRPYSTLAARYGLPTIRVRPSSQQQSLQTVDQEFSSYILSTPSLEDTHPLAFWEVSSLICVQSIISYFGSFTEPRSRPSMRSRSTTFRFRLLQFHVNASFPQVVKLTRRNETVSRPY